MTTDETRDNTVGAVTLTHGPHQGAPAAFIDETRDNMTEIDTTTTKINRQMAEDEFQRWLDRARIDPEFDESDEDGEARVMAKKRIIGAIEKGDFTVDDDGIGGMTADVKGAQTEILFKNFYTGAHTAMDKKKDGHNFAKLNSSLSAVTGHPDKTFATMHPTDAKLCQAVALLFLA